MQIKVLENLNGAAAAAAHPPTHATTDSQSSREVFFFRFLHPHTNSLNDGCYVSLLVMMKREFEKGGGRNQEGIFRLAPNAEDCSMTKSEMNNGEFEGVDDVNVIANLIKVSFSS